MLIVDAVENGACLARNSNSGLDYIDRDTRSQAEHYATCYNSYILLSPRPHSYSFIHDQMIIHARRAGCEYYAPDLSEEPHQ